MEVYNSVVINTPVLPLYHYCHYNVTSMSDKRVNLQKVREQLSQEVTAKDVATAEALYKQHQELRDDIKAHDDE